MQEGSHSYDAVLDYDSEVYNIYRAKSTHYWASEAAGKLVWKITGDGNSITLHNKELKKKITLDYSQAAELRIILNLINTNPSLFELTTAVEVSAEEIPV
jgi:hypothetical protein